MDKFSVRKRSQIMSRIRSSNTQFERDFLVRLRRATRRRFLTNVPTLRGKPDIVFRKSKVCVFLDSDFWHGWQYPRWKRNLKNKFWKDKIQYNRIRDRKTTAYLKKNGWQVIRIWGHEIKKDADTAVSSVIKVL